MKRNVRFMIWGFFFAIIGHYYLLLSNYLLPGKSFVTIVAKLFIDQVLVITLLTI